VNYLSDHLCNALEKPGPFTYDPDYNYTQRKFTCSVSMRKPVKAVPLSAQGDDKDDEYPKRPVKSKGPDVGSYELKEQGNDKQSIRKSMPSFSFGKVEHIRYTTSVAKAKAYIPGVGNYKHEDCYKKLSRPPSA
jgi:hypothetical protein